MASSPTRDPRLEEMLLASDAAYFALASQNIDLDGALLSVSPDFGPMPSACAVTSVSREPTRGFEPQWLFELEPRLRNLGFGFARIYLSSPHPLSAALQERDYQSRTELGFFGNLPDLAPSSGLSICRLDTDADWDEKLRIHRGSLVQPDGYEATPDRWLAFERAKCRTGQMTAYLAWEGSQAVGTFCTLEHDGFLRLKNLVVRAAARRQGFGERIIQQALQLSLDKQLGGVVAMAVSGSAGERLYRGAGMTPIGRVVEWRKELCRTDWE